MQKKPGYREAFLDALKLKPYPRTQLEDQMKSWTERATDLTVPLLATIRLLRVGAETATVSKEAIDALMKAADDS